MRSSTVPADAKSSTLAAPQMGRSWLPWVAALAAFAPLLWCWRSFHELFWFGDEWDQLDQISRMGFWKWTATCFGENFAPLLKLSWGGLAFASHGSYFFMVAAVWCVHALCVGLLGRWLQRAGFGPLGTITTLVLFGVAAINIEVLGWTIQLITIQGMVFFLAAALWRHARDDDGKWTALAFGVLVVLVTLSTFSFVRGALTGGSLAGAALLALLSRKPARERWRTSTAVAVACFLPAIASIAIILKFAPGNHHHLATAGFAAPALFGGSYFLLNPFWDLVAGGPWTTPVLVAFGLFKVAVLGFGWGKATAAQRRVLLPLFLFDIGNALLMGIGRYNEPLVTATSSRYQYVSLICTLPFLAVLLDALLDQLRRWSALRVFASVVVTIGAVWLAAHAWRRDMSSWAEYRGRNTRDVLFRNPNPPAEGAIPGIPFLPTSRAKELVVLYNLH